MFLHVRYLALFTLLGWRAAFAMDLYGTLAHEAVLDPQGKYKLSWDFDNEYIVFEVQVQTLGYVGLGLSPNGGMTGADIVIADVSDEGNVYLSDRHAFGNESPMEDTSQDYYLVWGRQTDTETVVRFYRDLSTCDDDDWDISSDTVRVIWAYHDQDWGMGRYHGQERRGAKSLLLLNPQRILPYIPSDSYTVDFLNDQVQVPPEDTVYWCETFSMHQIQRKEHIIKIEPIIQPGNEQLVHHIVLLGCPANLVPTNSTAGRGGWCNSMPSELRFCSAITIYGWAVGGGAFYFPSQVGYPVGEADSPQVVVLQTHFDNPGRRSDFVDSSGLRLTLTHRLRMHDAGTMATGVAVYKTHVIPPYAGNFRTDGHCVPECTRQGLGNVSQINVFGAFPHAHLLGAGVKLRHIRDGTELKPIVEDNHYDFNYQDSRMVVPEAVVKPGDHLVTECTYNSLHKTTVTFGGEGTSEEMCLNFILFYPRIAISNCYSLVNMDLLAGFAGVTIHKNNFTVDEPESLSGRPLDEVLKKNIDWTDKRNRDRLQELTTSYDNPVQSLCFKDELLDAHGKFFKPPKINTPYEELGRCIHTSGAVTLSTLESFIYVILTAILFIH